MVDEATFDVWLELIPFLCLEQRQRGIAALISADDDCRCGSAEDGAMTDTWPDIEVPPTIADHGFALEPEAITPQELSSACAARVAEMGCPHCGGYRLNHWGAANGLPRYRCSDCERTFNALTGTPLARLRHKDRWLEQVAAMNAGEATATAAARCGVDYTTAFRWRHRFLTAPADDKPDTLTGTVEADETFILESFKGKRGDLPRAARKRGGKAVKRGLSAEQIPILVAIDREGGETDAVLPRVDIASVTAALGGVVTPNNILCCDGGKAIVGFAKKANVPYHILPSPGGPKPDAPEFHINGVNGYHGRLKEWMRRFHGVATRYLPNYLGWRRAIEAIGHDASPDAWFHRVLGRKVPQYVTP